jgi:hypothetical protein
VNERDGLKAKVHELLKDLVEEGAPLWFMKVHGSAFSRDKPDYLLCVGGDFAAVELKHPENPQPPTPKQERELRRIRKARGHTLVSHELHVVAAFVTTLLARAGWHRAITRMAGVSAPAATAGRTPPPPAAR